jgi:methylglutaconyl-CoA hydratase
MLHRPPKIVFDCLRKYLYYSPSKNPAIYQTRHLFSLSEASREVILNLNYPHAVPNSTVTANSGVAVITLNRPSAANALGFNLMNEMKEILNYLNDTIDQNQQRCCIIRSSSPKVFCAGADLKERKSMNMSEVVECVDKLRQTFDEISRLPIPTISVIEGAALGGGFEMALATDIRVASTNATFGLVETSLAIIPGAGGTQRLPRLIGVARAKEIIFTARKFNAEKALEMGIVQHTAEPGKTMQKALS